MTKAAVLLSMIPFLSLSLVCEHVIDYTETQKSAVLHSPDISMRVASKSLGSRETYRLSKTEFFASGNAFSNTDSYRFN